MRALALAASDALRAFSDAAPPHLRLGMMQARITKLALLTQRRARQWEGVKDRPDSQAALSSACGLLHRATVAAVHADVPTLASIADEAAEGAKRRS